VLCGMLSGMAVKVSSFAHYFYQLSDLSLTLSVSDL